MDRNETINRINQITQSCFERLDADVADKAMHPEVAARLKQQIAEIQLNNIKTAVEMPEEFFASK